MKTAGESIHSVVVHREDGAIFQSNTVLVFEDVLHGSLSEICELEMVNRCEYMLEIEEEQM